MWCPREAAFQGTSTLPVPTDRYSDNKDHAVVAVKSNPRHTALPSKGQFHVPVLRLAPVINTVVTSKLHC